MATTGMTGRRVALVTGANQGIGFEIVKQLCRKFDGQVLLGARNMERGKQAVRELESEGLNPEFVLLDVSNSESIKNAQKWVQEKYGRLDVLVNNAGVLLRKDVPLPERARQTITVNYHGLLNVTKSFWTLLQPHSRIVHVSSGLGRLSKLGKKWQEKIRSPELTVDQLSAIMDQYVKDASSDDYDTKEWISDDTYADSYSVSKIGVTKLAELQAKQLEKDPRPGILVNALCPGWVRTNMGGPSASLSVEEGADTPVYLALLPVGATEPNGKFLRNRKVLSGYL